MISANGGLPAHRYTPQVTPGWPRGSEPASDIHLSNIPGSTAPKYPTEPHLSNVLGVYSPKIFDGRTSVKYFGDVGPPKCLTDVHQSNICGVYTPQIFDGTTFVKYFRGLHPPNI